MESKLGYHYTSVDILFKILEGISDDEFTLHASSVFAMNDPSEFEYGLNHILNIVLPRLEVELQVENPNYQLSKLLDKDYVYNREAIKMELLKRISKSNDLPFVISYSKKRDYLSQWKSYGDDGKGIALGLDVHTFYIKKEDDKGKIILDTTPYSYHAINVAYGSLTKNHLAYIYIKDVYNRYLRDLGKNVNNKDLIERQLDAFYSIIINAAPFIKHKAYKDERESRIVIYKQRHQQMLFKRSRFGFVPYIEVKMPIHYLKEIIFGPCCKDKNVIEMQLAQLNLFEIETSPSSIPYR